MSDQTIVEISANRLVLARAVSDTRMPAFTFVTPKNWRVGDPIIMQINRSPHEISYDDNGNVVATIPKEPHNEWKREFYVLQNLRTKDSVTVDFDWVDGFDKLEAEYRSRHK
jgi:hypothetical protein